LPYVVVRDPEDAADEMLTGSGDLTITVQSTEANASFAPLNDWWFLHPALADVAGGVLAFGTQYLQIPIDRPLTDGAIEVSWIATPLGGRVRVEAAGKRFVADTQATPAQWQSAILRAGRLPRGSLVSLTTMDPHGVVAIRTIRAVEASELRQRRARYDDLLRHAKDVFAWRPLRAGIWKTVRTGRSLELGPCSSAFDYRLRARYAASGDDELLVVGPKNAIIGFGRLRARGHDAAATFNGVDAALHLQTKDSRVLDWVLQERPTVRLGAVATRGFLLPTGDVRAGTFDGIRARLPDAGRVAVLNVGFGNNWVPSRNGARHVETALGTNAWIFPNGAKGPLAIDDVYVPPFHEAFSLGTFALLGGLAVPAGLVFLQRRKR
jgi:hypothetical protein